MGKALPTIGHSMVGAVAFEVALATLEAVSASIPLVRLGAMEELDVEIGKKGETLIF